EGAGRNAGFDSADLSICENLYLQGPGAVVAPFYTYPHGQTILPGESCPAGSSAITGLGFYTGGSYPLEYNGALFFSDYSRNCIWAMLPGANGLPDPTNRRTFDAPAAGPVDLEIGPGGDVFYVDFNGGTVRRIVFDGPPPPPPTGEVPVNAYRGEYFDNADLTNLKMNRTDAAIDFDWGFGSPDPSIEPDTFSVRGTDAEDGPLPASALSWHVIMHHCSPVDPTSCHTHSLQTFPGVADGSFVAPDHEYPSYLEFQLTAKDSGGLTDVKSVLLYPQTVVLTFDTSPTGVGLKLVVSGTATVAPFDRTVIVGGTISISAPSPKTVGLAVYVWLSWSDGGAQTHNIVAGSTPARYTATYLATPPLGFQSLTGLFLISSLACIVGVRGQATAGGRGGPTARFLVDSV